MERTNWKRKEQGIGREGRKDGRNQLEKEGSRGLDGKGKGPGETKQEATIGEADKEVDCKEIEMEDERVVAHEPR
ncbi:TPA: hypothetical protein HA338_00445 [Methanosarcina acetivorans]|uniref:Uncharacterized protein n=1 Tax=Methanosarcina acetivorans TaxID=2214 RepID=A0A832S6N0_9EURY|nr:hypothetical protein [Methanosarcina acetivorans]HIH92561.1 hypothetical protein [Methanosarcina acetivorans]